MSFYDYFEPVPKRRCQKCFSTLTDWQGCDAENAFFIWRQGSVAPVDQLVSEDAKCPLEVRKCQKLPETFSFSTACDVCETRVTAEGLCVEGIWRYTLIRDPKFPYPSGEEHPLFRLNILVQELADRLGKPLEVYEEDGLGTFRAFDQSLSFDAIIVAKQSDHLVNKQAFGEEAHKGPVIYVDAYDALKFGYGKMYWGALHALNISEKNVDMEYPNPSEWCDHARELIWKT